MFELLKLKKITAVAFFLSLCMACTSEGNKANLLNPDVKYRSDTMFAKHRSLIIKELDSLCILQQDKLIKSGVDSLLKLSKIQNAHILPPK